MAASPDHLARYSGFTLGATVAVSIWGAFVRATGSGAGCGSHWPLCDGAVMPRDASTAMLIEYSHRLTSGLAFLAVVALFVVIRRSPAASALARRAALASVVFMTLEAAIGAGLVLFQLVADNASLARAMFMATHLVNTFALVASLTVTMLATTRPAAGSLLARVPALIYLGALALLLTNVSGAVAALGDTLFPAASLSEAVAQDLSVSSHVLIRLRLLHPLLAVLSAGLLTALAGWAARRFAGTPRIARLVMVGVAAQIVAGVLNVVLLAPVWLQLVHLLLANAIWIAYVALAFTAALSPLREAAAVPKLA